ncbi:hypothetical protein BJY24_001051 [Nocardia transvalensis]|uniref:Uncharacterized protein n=1 Tax=Nocardia transvalensis TaxID=37333 RepID=A0A7W9UGE2_9NOCA|nr:hypothetical protein [Nocardia transvalensis]MBB5912184.1 hypothetical protein [Nocardia transvalensis]
MPRRYLFDRMTAEDRLKATTEVIDDSNKKFPLTDSNAEAALRTGPAGTTPQVAGPGGAGADITFVDDAGNVVAPPTTTSGEHRHHIAHLDVSVFVSPADQHSAAALGQAA